MAVNALTAVVSAMRLSDGDDPAVLMQALQGARSGEMIKVSEAAQDTLLQHISRLQALLGANFASRLQALPNSPDGTGKMLGDMKTGQAYQCGLPELGGTIPAQAAALGLSLPTQAWLDVETNTVDVNGNAVSFESWTPKSPSEIASYTAMYGQPVPFNRFDGAPLNVYTYTTGSGASATTTNIMVCTDEGQLCASNADIAALNTAVAAEIGRMQGLVSQDMALLDAFTQRLSRTMKGDQPLMDHVDRMDARTQDVGANLSRAVQATPRNSLDDPDRLI